MAQSTQSTQVSSRIEGVITKDGVRTFGSNGHGFTVVPYSGTEKPKAQGEKGDPRPAVFFDVAFFGDLPAGVEPGARVAVSGYVHKHVFTRKDNTKGEAANLKGFQVEVLDPNTQTNVTLVGRVGRDGEKALGTGKVFTMMPYSGKDKDGNFMPSIFVEVKVFGIEASVTAGSNVKVVGTLSRRDFKRADGTPGVGYELFAKSVAVLESNRQAAPAGSPAESTLGYEDSEYEGTLPVF